MQDVQWVWLTWLAFFEDRLVTAVGLYISILALLESLITLHNDSFVYEIIALFKHQVDSKKIEQTDTTA